MLVCPGLVEAVEDGAEASLDLERGRIEHEGRTYDAEPLPAAVRAIAAAGGLVPFVRRRLERVA